MMLMFFAGLLVGIVIFGVVEWRKWLTLRRFVQYLANSMDVLGEGRYESRVFHYNNHPFKRELARAFNHMAGEIEDTVDKLSHERDVLSHILENMQTGVVYIEHGGKVRTVNDAAQRMFRRPAEQWTDREHWATVRDYNLGAAIDEALLFGKPWESELQLQGKQTFHIRLVPMETKIRARAKEEIAYDVLMLATDVSEWRRLERMRSEFVANVSHELKTPIAAIRGFAETLLDGDVDEVLQTRFLKTIYEESNRMGNLVSDLLELSKLEAMEHEIHPVCVELEGVIKRAVDRLHAVASARNIKIYWEPFGTVYVWAEEDKLLQVFLNLLGNAIHYSPDGASVAVSCEVLVDRVKVHVRDRGVGIPEEHLNRVFERFYRVHRDRSRASGGTGLGLAIVKHIVATLGGEVGVDSKEGQGSDFWFTLSRLEGGESAG